MIIRKRFLVLLLSASVLVGCNQGESSETSNSDIDIQISIKKHEAVKLPVDIFVDSDYTIQEQQVGFTRSITGVEIKNFDESSEIEVLERYGNAVSSQGFNLQKDFKLLVITMEHKTQGEAGRSPLEGYVLNVGSGLVIGDEPLVNKNEFLRYQEAHMVKEYKVGTTFEEKGNILLAVPNEFANDKNLQLKINQKLDNKNKFLYIDLY